MKLEVSLSANLLLLVVGAVLLFGWKTKTQEIQYYAGLSDQLKLDTKTRAKVVVQGNTVYVVQTLPGGLVPQTSTNTQITSHYVPPESSHGAVVTIPNDPKEPITVKVQNKGFCMVPGMGIGYGLGYVQPFVDVKFLYWNRYGASAGVASKGLVAGASRHLDDVTRFKNLEWYLGAEMDWDLFKGEKPEWGAFTGPRVNF